MTKEAVKVKKTGQDLLREAYEEVTQAQEYDVRHFLSNIVGRINERKKWIKNRTKQINQLEAMQIELVKAFDNGDLSKELLKDISMRLDVIQNERVG